MIISPESHYQDRTYSTLLHRTSTNTSRRTILGVIAEYEEAITKEGDKRQRTPEDQSVRSTLAVGKHQRRISETIDHKNAFTSPVHGLAMIVVHSTKVFWNFHTYRCISCVSQNEFDRSNSGSKTML